ncbi:hypothetical protein MTR67_036552 [Solanum verrucosum]|uniref:Large ribosomal subunit protein uL2 C-terminal domain-containing protein n=1 Tax=Solanum verrucosum TaxID=315347 RepID=A0AAF0UBZ9_SOLVR|nr:hypothetical protein MTR67_036552 [Solanum verrucosum]
MALCRARMASSFLLRNVINRSFSTSPFEAMISKMKPSKELESMMDQFSLDISSQIGSCMPIGMMRIGTLIHNIEMRPGQGGKLVRSAGTCAKILTEPNASTKYCEVKLPSGVKKLIDVKCRATIGQVSNPEHGTKKLRKAGQSRWLGRRPTVRGVAMNPVDHPHGGGEGRSKSSGSHGRGSLTPWGKPTKVLIFLHVEDNLDCVDSCSEFAELKIVSCSKVLVDIIHFFSVGGLSAVPQAKAASHARIRTEFPREGKLCNTPALIHCTQTCGNGESIWL